MVGCHLIRILPTPIKKQDLAGIQITQISRFLSINIFSLTRGPTQTNFRSEVRLCVEPCLTTPNNIFTNNTKNWLISIQRHSDYQRIPRCSKKKLKRLHQNSLKNISIFIHLPHTLEKLLRRLFSETGLAENLINNLNET